MASSSGDSSYSRASVHWGCRCSVPARCVAARRCSACSIGSCGSISLASTAYSSRSWKVSGRSPGGRLCESSSSPPPTSAATAMRLRVRVPVLSTHSTVVWPSVSMALSRRVSTCWAASRRAASARKTIMMTGNSCGRMPMASVMPASIASSQPPRSSQNSAIRARLSDQRDDHEPTRQPWPLHRAAARPASVMVCSDTPMRPISVCRPDGVHPHQALTAHDQRAGEDPIRARLLGHRLGLAGQHRLVGGQFMRLQQHAVGRHAVAFGQQQHVFAHHLAARDANGLRRHGGPARVGWTGRAGHPGPCRCGAPAAP